MKTLVKTALVTTVVLSMISCKENKQDATTSTSEEMKVQNETTVNILNQEFKDDMTGETWHAYLKLKRALVKSNTEDAQMAASAMAENYGEEQAEIKDLAQQIATSADLEKQRELFAALTEKSGPLFTDALADRTVYKQFCPMAFNNRGGYWYSDVAEIRNPYYGDKMLKCGKVVKEIQ